MAKRAKRDTVNYVLKQGNKIVYVGKTKTERLEKRLAEHARSGKKFTGFDFSCSASDETARQTERAVIEHYEDMHGGERPKYNKTGHG
jgi:hypothetical protein